MAVHSCKGATTTWLEVPTWNGGAQTCGATQREQADFFPSKLAKAAKGKRRHFGRNLYDTFSPRKQTWIVMRITPFRF